MLDEAPEHCTARRGCGFTQATRHLAQCINDRDSGDRDSGPLHDRLFRRPPDPGGAEAIHARLTGLDAWLAHPESRLLLAMLRDIVLPARPADPHAVDLPVWPEPLAVGSCPTAEKHFLDLAHGMIARRGRINLLMDDAGQVAIIEKGGMGDDGSCVSLRETRINDVNVPPGSLLAVQHRREEAAPSRLASHPLRHCAGFRMLRLTTLAIDPLHRRRAFGQHFAEQERDGLLDPAGTELADLRAAAERLAAG